MAENQEEFFHPEKPKLKGTTVLGKIELKDEKKKKFFKSEGKTFKKVDPTQKNVVKVQPLEEKKDNILWPEEELEMRAKVGYQFDKIWKDKLKTRLQMQVWAIHLLELKMPPQDFSINKLSFKQVQVLGLKLKFQLDIFN